MSDKGLVLITGLNGFIAARTAEAFLQAGYRVRGTVRRAASAQPVIDALPQYASNLEVVEVPDITAPGAFDEAVKGVDAIAHLAAPVSLSFTEVEPVLRAAEEGTSSLMESTTKEPSIKAMVLMSSIAAIRDRREGPYVYTEKDWNDQMLSMVQELGNKAPSYHIYAASKVLSERVFWKFREEKKPKFTMTAINPTFVAGPTLTTPESSEGIPGSTLPIFQVFKGEKFPELFENTPWFVDVRDVARLVLFAVEQPAKADGERFIACAVYAPTQAIVDILLEARTDLLLDKGTPGAGYLKGFKTPHDKVTDGSKALKTTGEWIPFEKTVLDTIKAYESL